MSVDCIVTAMRDYEGELTHLKVLEIKNGEAMPPEARAKGEVVDDIRLEEKTYYTATPDEDDGDSYVLRKKIRVVEKNTEAFLRTDDRIVQEDALESLPKF